MAKSQDDKVEKIRQLFINRMKEDGQLPLDDNFLKNLKVDSDLRQILAIPDRLSYLAKGIIRKSVKDDVQLLIYNLLYILMGMDLSNLSVELGNKIILNTIALCTDEIIDMLGLQVESNSPNEEDTGKMIKRLPSTKEQIEIVKKPLKKHK